MRWVAGANTTSPGGGRYLQVSQEADQSVDFPLHARWQASQDGSRPRQHQTDDKRITLAGARQRAAAARSLLIDGIARDARRAQGALADAQATGISAIPYAWRAPEPLGV